MTPRYPLIVYGAGGHGLIVAEAATLGGWQIEGFIDDKLPVGAAVGKWRVLGDVSVLNLRTGSQLIIAIGDNGARAKVIQRLDASDCESLQVILHPSAIVSASAVIGPGVFIGPAAVVNAEANIDTGAIINSGAVVEHHNRIGASAHIGPGAVLCGNVTVGARTLIGAGAVVIPGITIGEDAVIGAGAVVIRDVAAKAKVCGNPARPI